MEPIEKHGAGDLVCACYDVVDRRSTSPSDRHCTVYRMCRVVEEQFYYFGASETRSSMQRRESSENSNSNRISDRIDETRVANIMKSNVSASRHQS